MRRGQSLTEVGLIGGLIVGVGILSIVLLGDNVNNFFKVSNVKNVFNEKRSQKTESPQKYLSQVNLEIAGQNFNSPVESVIAQKIMQNNYQQTSGSSGQIRETLEIITKYIEQIRNLMNSPSSGFSSIEIAKMENILKMYEQNINEYIALDENKATPDNLKLASMLDISVNLSMSGESAMLFYDTVNGLLSNMPDNTNKKLLEKYSDSILSLGSSLDYSVDSRKAQELNLQNELEKQTNNYNNVQEKMTEISGALAQLLVFVDKKNDDEEKVNDKDINFSFLPDILPSCEYSFTNPFTGSYVTVNFNCEDDKSDCKKDTITIDKKEIEKEVDKTIKTVNSLKKDIDKYIEGNSSKAKNIYSHIKKLENHKNTLTSLNVDNSILSQLENLIKLAHSTIQNNADQKLALIDKLKNNAISENTLKTIDVYRTGNYSDIVPDTYNNYALCESIGGTVNNKKCELN